MKNLPIQIENKVGRVRLNDVVSKGLIDPLMDQICTLWGNDDVRNAAGDDEGHLTTLEIDIDSPGGSVAEGYRLYKTITDLRDRGVDVVVNITKLAASMGSVIAMAATKVRMASNARFMIHDAQAAAQGSSDRLRKVAVCCEQISNEIAGIYASRTGYSPESVRAVMKQEGWFDAETALALGFVDEVYQAKEKEWNPSILERLIGNKAEKNALDANATKLHLDGKNSMSLLDKLRPDTSALASKLEGVETDLVTSQAELAEAKILITDAAAELADFKAQIATAEDKAADFEAKLKAAEEKAEAELDAANKSLVAEQAKTAPDAIAKLVTAQLAEAGHPALESEPNAGLSASATPHLDKINSLTGEVRSAYYAKHEADIKAELSN